MKGFCLTVIGLAMVAVPLLAQWGYAELAETWNITRGQYRDGAAAPMTCSAMIAEAGLLFSFITVCNTKCCLRKHREV